MNANLTPTLQGAASYLAILLKVQALLQAPHARVESGAWASGVAVILDCIFTSEHASKYPKMVISMLIQNA